MRTPGLEPIDARVLLAHVLSVGHAYLVAHSERVLNSAESEHLAALTARRIAGEPVAYLTGAREFYGRSFVVGPAVLVPRPETELLVELALERLACGGTAQLLDLGTGSGNIAITIALERPGSRVVGVDASFSALSIAALNAARLAAVSVRLLCAEWSSSLGSQTFDMLLSNPPYVASADPHLARGDLRFEPRAALTPGPDGLRAIRSIVADAPRLLRPGGWLMFEHGYDQGPAARELLRSVHFEQIFTASDLAGLERVSGGRRSD